MAGAELFKVPNLDGLSVDPADMREAARVLFLLGSYVSDKARSSELRLEGDVEAAVSFERCADATYKRLPGWARW